MGETTGIEWTESTWNPVSGCSKVSQGCKHCYAERDWKRLAHLPAYQGRQFTDVACHPERLDQPLRWKRPRRIFVNSMSDLFHPDISDAFIDRVFAVMALAPWHTFQVLTKRPERMLDYIRCGGGSCINVGIRHAVEKMGYPDIGAIDKALKNVWLGCSVEDQATADERIPLLLRTPAAVRWISAEPLLGPVSLDCWPIFGEDEKHLLQWVVVGGESGPKARPMHPDWARSLRDQCAAAGVAFLFKQWGEWSPKDPGETPHSDTAGVLPSGDAAFRSAGYIPPWGTNARAGDRLDGRTLLFRVGKKRAGRLLDGVQHDGYPGLVP